VQEYCCAFFEQENILKRQNISLLKKKQQLLHLACGCSGRNTLFDP